MTPTRRIAVCFLAGLALLAGALPAFAQDIPARLIAVSEVKLVLPHDMALTPDGASLVVADMGRDRVVLLNADTLTFQAVLAPEDGMSFPHDVAFDALGRLMVADSGNDRILVYALDGTEARQVAVWDGLNGVEGVAAAPDGAVYAALVAENRVVRLKDGHIERTAAQALGMALDRPHDVVVVEDRFGVSVVATDPGNHRLIVFDTDLNPLYEVSTWDPPFSEPKYISIDARGAFYVADQYNNRVRVLSSSAQTLGDLAANEARLPEGVHVDDNRVWVADTERGRVLLYLLEESH